MGLNSRWNAGEESISELEDRQVKRNYPETKKRENAGKSKKV